MDSTAKERDLIGYGRNLPQIEWPNKAKLALNFVLNYEEGAEANILDGDESSESYLADLPGVSALKGQRHLSVESIFEYGSRSAIWRLLDLFDAHGIPITFFAAGLALERNTALADALKESRHELAGHGYRWIDYRHAGMDLERLHVEKTIKIIQDLTKKKVSGWYTGRRSSNTREILVQSGLLYDSDSYADDLPYWVKVLDKPHLIIPYQLDTNDFRYATSPGWSNGQQYFDYLKWSVDCLRKEGKRFPKMMTVGMHARLSGRPGRCEALHHFIRYIKQFEDIWICRRVDIAEFWIKQSQTR